MEFRARVIGGRLVLDEPTKLPEGREVLLTLVPDEPSDFEQLLQQMESTYDDLAALLSQRKKGILDKALEAQIVAKQEEIARYKQQRIQLVETTLKSQRSA